jgi:uncharacterized protein (TIGR02246 family)
MNLRRTLVFSAALTVLPRFATAQTPAGEAALRDTIRDYTAAWNRHDVPAWTQYLTADVWFTEAMDFYERNKDRDKVVPLFEWNVKNSDLELDILRVRMMPDGTATASLRTVARILPKTDGKYKAEFESTPSVSRWRLEEGRWRMFFFTSHKGWALDVMKKDGLE